jgi:hypothetical protein
MAEARYGRSVFLNCPFDGAYKPLFEAVVFAIYDSGYIARCSLEIDDSSQVRIDKIARLIASCRFGIHDISRTAPDPKTALPRFNMPLELGMFLGAKRFGSGRHKKKICLILDTEQYRFQKFVSDIGGQDISAHRGEPAEAIRIVRNWLNNAAPRTILVSGGTVMASRYQDFRRDLPKLCAALRLRTRDLTFNNFVLLLEEWIEVNSPPPGSGARS